jgi:hypothetical protein
MTRLVDWGNLAVSVRARARARVCVFARACPGLCTACGVGFICVFRYFGLAGGWLTCIMCTHTPPISVTVATAATYRHYTLQTSSSPPPSPQLHRHHQPVLMCLTTNQFSCALRCPRHHLPTHLSVLLCLDQPLVKCHNEPSAWKL